MTTKLSNLNRQSNLSKSCSGGILRVLGLFFQAIKFQRWESFLKCQKLNITKRKTQLNNVRTNRKTIGNTSETSRNTVGTKSGTKSENSQNNMKQVGKPYHFASTKLPLDCSQEVLSTCTFRISKIRNKTLP